MPIMNKFLGCNQSRCLLATYRLLKASDTSQSLLSRDLNVFSDADLTMSQEQKNAI